MRKLPAFQGDSGFDINKLNDLVQNGLAPLGLAEEHIEQLVRDQICLTKSKSFWPQAFHFPKTSWMKIFAGAMTNSKSRDSVSCRRFR